jgi:predicted transcriptional regulator
MTNSQLLVQDWMHTNVLAVNPELHVERAWEVMERQRVHHLPVVKNNQLVYVTWCSHFQGIES